MGGAVSSGRDNNELIDNLKAGDFIRTRDVELAFRAIDRGDYLLPDVRHQAYKDLAWRSGPLHMSAPCIYSEVMENLELQPNQSFLNIGSGTGYLSTIAGLILGTGGINHGVEIYQAVVDYAQKKLKEFLEGSHALNEFDFAEPKFFVGNGLCLAPLQTAYDRVYCGAGCPEEYQNYLKQLIKIGGVLVMPLNNFLVQMRRLSVSEWSTRTVLSVQFASLRVPAEAEARELFRIDDISPPRLQVLARGVVRAAVRTRIMTTQPSLAPPINQVVPTRRNQPRRICIPIDDDSDVEQLNALHDLDRESGANEMNALLNLVLSMGNNHVAGAIRFDTLDSDSTDGDTDDQNDPMDEDGIPDEGEEEVFQVGVCISGLRNRNRDRNAPAVQPELIQPEHIQPEQIQPEHIQPEHIHPEYIQQEHIQPEYIQPEPIQDNAQDNITEAATTADNSNKTSQFETETKNDHSHLNGNSPKAGGSRSHIETERVPNDDPSIQSTSQTNQSNRSETMSELCDRTIYRALTGHDRPANSNETDQSTRGKVSVTLEYNEPLGLCSSSNDENQQPSTNSNKKRRNRKRSSRDSLNSKVDEQQTEPTENAKSQDKSTEISDDEDVAETCTSQGKRKAKRKKFDSGFGDGASPSTSTGSKELDENIPSDVEDCKSRNGDGDDCSTSDCSTSSCADRNPRVTRTDRRRLEVTYLTVAAIRTLPLPPALKQYVNMGRPIADRLIVKKTDA